MNQQALELQERTRRFASAIISFCETLPRAPATQHISEQLVASSTSADSNYRATCRSRSPDEFIAKIGTAAEEADESKGWLQLLVQSNFVTMERARALIQESDELVAIFVASRKTAQKRKAERERLRKQAQAAARSRLRRS